MPTGYPLTDDEKLKICEMLENGYKWSDISKATGVSVASVGRVKHEFYGKDVRSMEAVIAGDKKHGTLVASGPGHFVGTCLIANGKVKKRHFNCKDSKTAITQWESWKKSCISTKPKNDIPIQEKTNPIEQDKTIQSALTKLEQTSDTIYVLLIDEPKIAGYFNNLEEANRVAAISNQSLEFAEVPIRYHVVAINPYSEPSK